MPTLDLYCGKALPGLEIRKGLYLALSEFTHSVLIQIAEGGFSGGFQSAELFALLGSQTMLGFRLDIDAVRNFTGCADDEFQRFIGSFHLFFLLIPYKCRLLPLYPPAKSGCQFL
jgi:hypothetical protein